MTISVRSNVRRAFAIWLAGAAVCAPAFAQTGTLPAKTLDDFPHQEISNGLITAQVYPPGERELYKGTRFDHAGVVQHITYKGQDFTQYWFDRYLTDPKDTAKYPRTENACCAVSGPVEEFDPVGFDDAKTGGGFLKIGIGILARGGDTYTPFVQSTILDAGKRTNKINKTGARFTQDIDNKETGYGYRYVKTVELESGMPTLRIIHVLTNTGRKPIVTTLYNHNFLTLSSGNENVEITAPFAMAATKPLQPELARIDGNSLRHLAPVPPGTTVTSPITGFGATAADFDFRIRNTKTGFGVRMRADQPIARINFWSVNTVLGWEPYTAIALKPGETKRWTNSYDYSGPGDAN